MVEVEAETEAEAMKEDIVNRAEVCYFILCDIKITGRFLISRY